MVNLIGDEKSGPLKSPPRILLTPIKPPTGLSALRTRQSISMISPLCAKSRRPTNRWISLPNAGLPRLLSPIARPSIPFSVRNDVNCDQANFIGIVSGLKAVADGVRADFDSNFAHPQQFVFRAPYTAYRFARLTATGTKLMDEQDVAHEKTGLRDRSPDFPLLPQHTIRSPDAPRWPKLLGIPWAKSSG